MNTATKTTKHIIDTSLFVDYSRTEVLAGAGIGDKLDKELRITVKIDSLGSAETTFQVIRKRTYPGIGIEEEILINTRLLDRAIEKYNEL